MNANDTRTVLESRYGKKKPRFSPKVLLTTSAIALLLSFIAWLVLLVPRQHISSTTISYSVIDDKHVDLTVSITNTSGSPLRCTFQALDDSFTVIGWKEKKYPAFDDNYRDTIHIRTERPAVSANIKECWAVHSA